MPRKPKIGVREWCPFKLGHRCSITNKPTGPLCYTPRYAGCPKIKRRGVQ